MRSYGPKISDNGMPIFIRSVSFRRMDFVPDPKLHAWDTKSNVTDLPALDISSLIMNNTRGNENN